MKSGVDFLQLWKAPDTHIAISRLLGESPMKITLERTHFPGKRPVQMNFIATLASGEEAQVLAEYCTVEPVAHRDAVFASLRKSRNGQRAALDDVAIVADVTSGLVLRRPGLDERLPGLRLLYDPPFAREVVNRVLGCDPGPVEISLVAHRLGKRAVLRIDTAERCIYARLRAIKSTDGAQRFARHQTLWSALAECQYLHIPEPLGSLPEFGLSLFSELPGETPNFTSADNTAIARALEELRKLDLDELPEHRATDEAQLLNSWLIRCRHHRPALAIRLEEGIADVTLALVKNDVTLCPSHRDLHEKQILTAEGKVGLLDFDTLSLADPALDVGNLLAHLFFAGLDERPLRLEFDLPGIGLWRRAALFRLAMIYAFTSTPEATLNSLIEEATNSAEH